MFVLRSIARLSRPLYILLAALTYTLGAGISRYLGIPTNLDVLVLGLVGTVLAQASMGLLAAVFRPVGEPFLENETREERRTLRSGALYVSVSALAAIAFIGFVIRRLESLSAPALLTLGLSLVVILLFAVPPIRLADRGFGELLLAVQVAHVTPSMGFLLQAGSYHPLVYPCIAALTLLLIATLVALDFPTFAHDLKYGRATLLTRMGWENALRAHQVLVVGAYLILAAAALSGYAVGLFLPAFLTIPFAAFQLYLLRGLGQGAKPVWGLVRANAVAIFGLTAYLLTLGFWFR